MNLVPLGMFRVGASLTGRDGDGDGGAVAARAAAVDAGVAAVVHREAQGVVAVVVGGALVVEVAQGGVEVGGGAAQVTVLIRWRRP